MKRTNIGIAFCLVLAAAVLCGVSLAQDSMEEQSFVSAATGPGEQAGGSEAQEVSPSTEPSEQEQAIQPPEPEAVQPAAARAAEEPSEELVRLSWSASSARDFDPLFRYSGYKKNFNISCYIIVNFTSISFFKLLMRKLNTSSKTL